MQFRTLALATTSLVALGLAAQANAANQMMGDVRLGFGLNWEEYDVGPPVADIEYPGVFGQGRVNIPYSDMINVQVDVTGSGSLDTDPEAVAPFSGKSVQYGHFGIGGHLNYRDDTGLLGVFAGTGRTWDYVFGSTVFMAGFEGQYYCGPWTFRGQLAYLDADEDWFMLQNAGAARIGASYYLGKQIRFTTDLAYIDGEQAQTGFDAEQWAWGVGASYWFGKSIPASVFVEYRGRQADVDDGPNWQIEDHAVNFGFAFHFGGDGFEDADRNGASTELPDFGWYRLPID